MNDRKAAPLETDPTHLARIQAHNERIGIGLQAPLHRVWFIYLLGTFCVLFFRFFFRIRRRGHEQLFALAEKQPILVAARHFYEWDALMIYPTLFLPHAYLHPQLAPFSIAGRFWVRSSLLRFFSRYSGIMTLTRGTKQEQSAFAHSRRLLQDPSPKNIFIFPTGPVGVAKTYEIRPGVGHLAASCPDVKIVPFSVVGLQEVRLRDVLMLRRPRIDLLVGEPFTARELARGGAASADAVVARIDRDWKRLEGALDVGEELAADGVLAGKAGAR